MADSIDQTKSSFERRLREALLEARVATATQIEDAIARRELYGADVVTNLLELTRLDEATVVKALAQLYGLDHAPVGELPYASANALELVPQQTAISLGIYPFRLNENRLTVVVSEPLGEGARRDLGFGLKAELQVLFALSPRIRQATARDYAFALDRRSAKAVARLSKSNTLSSHPPPALADAPSFSQFPRPHSSPPFGFPDQWSDAVTPSISALLVETARQPSVTSLEPSDTAPQASRSLLDDPESPAPSLEEPIARAYTFAALQGDLQQATDANHVLDRYFDFASQFFDFTAILVVGPTSAQIKRVQGRGTATLDVVERQLPLTDFPCLAQVAQQGQWILAPLTTQEPALAQLLDRVSSHESLLLPLKVRNRVKLILVGGFDGGPVALNSIGELLAVEPLVTLALETVIMHRKGISKPPVTQRGRTEPAAKPPR